MYRLADRMCKSATSDGGAAARAATVKLVPRSTEVRKRVGDGRPPLRGPPHMLALFGKMGDGFLPVNVPSLARPGDFTGDDHTKWTPRMYMSFEEQLEAAKTGMYLGRPVDSVCHTTFWPPEKMARLLKKRDLVADFDRAAAEYKSVHGDLPRTLEEVLTVPFEVGLLRKLCKIFCGPASAILWDLAVRSAKAEAKRLDTALKLKQAEQGIGALVEVRERDRERQRNRQRQREPEALDHRSHQCSCSQIEVRETIDLTVKERKKTGLTISMMKRYFKVKPPPPPKHVLQGLRSGLVQALFERAKLGAKQQEALRKLRVARRVLLQSRAAAAEGARDAAFGPPHLVDCGAGAGSLGAASMSASNDSCAASLSLVSMTGVPPRLPVCSWAI